jgi:hypothetical protein
MVEKYKLWRKEMGLFLGQLREQVIWKGVVKLQGRENTGVVHGRPAMVTTPAARCSRGKVAVQKVLDVGLERGGGGGERAEEVLREIRLLFHVT